MLTAFAPSSSYRPRYWRRDDHPPGPDPRWVTACAWGPILAWALLLGWAAA